MGSKIMPTFNESISFKWNHVFYGDGDSSKYINNSDCFGYYDVLGILNRFAESKIAAFKVILMDFW